MTNGPPLASQSTNTLKYVAHGVALLLWFAAGAVFSLQQVFAAHGLGVTMNYWLWFTGFAAVSTFAVRFTKSAVAAMGVHAALAVVLNLIPTTMPWAMLRAGYDLLINRS